MPFKVGKRQCPDNVEGFMKEKGVFLASYIEFLDSALAGADLAFMLAHNRKVKPKVLYEKFIDSKLSQRINIGSEYALKMEELAKAKDWTNKDWKANLDGAYGQCFANIDSQEGPYFRSKHFRSALEATAKSNINYVDGKVISGVGMLNNREFINEKNLKMCARVTKMAAIMKRKRTPGANDTQSVAKGLYKVLAEKHSVASDYKAWQKLVDKHM